MKRQTCALIMLVILILAVGIDAAPKHKPTPTPSPSPSPVAISSPISPASSSGAGFWILVMMGVVAYFVPTAINSHLYPVFHFGTYRVSGRHRTMNLLAIILNNPWLIGISMLIIDRAARYFSQRFRKIKLINGQAISAKITNDRREPRTRAILYFVLVFIVFLSVAYNLFWLYQLLAPNTFPRRSEVFAIFFASASTGFWMWRTVSMIKAWRSRIQ